MNFYLIEVSTGDASIAGRAIYEYNNVNSAVANFHSKLGSAMKSDLFTSELIMVINEAGGVIKTEKFVKEVVTSEEEGEETPE